MTTTSSETLVGAPLSSISVPDLPVGTKVRGASTRRLWEKMGPNRWALIEGVTSLGDRTDERFGAGDSYTIEYVPDSMPALGDSLTTTDQYDALPVGSRFCAANGSGTEWTKTTDTDWTSSGGSVRNRANLSMAGANVLTHVAVVQSTAIWEDVLPNGVLATRAQLRRLPVGSIISGRYGQEVKQPGQVWRRPDGHQRDTSTISTSAYTYRLVSVPEDAPVATARTWEVGQRFDNPDELAEVPVCTVIGVGTDDRNTFTKEDDGRFRSTINPSVRHAPEAFFTGHDNGNWRTSYAIRSLPEPVGEEEVGPVADPGVGQRLLDRETALSLPVGTVIRPYGSSSGSRWTVIEGGSVRMESSGITNSLHDVRTDGYLMIDSMPPAAVTEASTEEASQCEVEFDPDQVDTASQPTVAETLEQFKQRFLTVVKGSSSRNSVSMDPARAAARQFEIRQPEPTPGMLVSAYDDDLDSTLPDGTVGTIGSITRPAGFAVFGRAGSCNWERLLGSTGADWSTYEPLRLITVPGFEVAEWVTATPTEADGEAILQFKREAWEMGYNAKVERQWCGVFETTMAMLGITADIMREEEPMITTEQALAEPVGTIFRFGGTHHGGSRLYRRTEGAPNPCGTVALGGVLAGDWASRGLRVVHRPDDGMAIPVLNTTEADTMPAGTSVGNRAGQDTFVKRDDGMWTYPTDASYTYRGDQLDFRGLVYTVIP